MDNPIPGWSIETQLPVPDQKKSIGVDHGLVELLWQNGQVVLNSQTHRKPGYGTDEFRQPCKHGESTIRSSGNSTNLIEVDETDSWIHCPIDESFEKELSWLDGNKFWSPNPLPPPRFESGNQSSLQHQNSGQNMGRQGEHSITTVGSSHCGSNQIVNELRMSRTAVGKNYSGKLSESLERETLETAITTSSGSSFGKTTCNQFTDHSNSHKRKIRDGEDTECQSEAVELESAGGNKSSQKSGTNRRSRATEVHNLSERRRRDRINEKMRALQELIPHSNKSDKASMLDEAIEYMKSLQLQVQMMWMGNGMAPMIFPSMQQYMSRMGMGMGIVPSIHNVPMHLLRMPMQVDQQINMQNQAAIHQNPVLNPVNCQNQMQTPKFHDQYANYMAFHQLQNGSQPMNMFNFGSHTSQQNHIQPPPPANGNGSTR